MTNTQPECSHTSPLAQHTRPRPRMLVHQVTVFLTLAHPEIPHTMPEGTQDNIDLPTYD